MNKQVDIDLDELSESIIPVGLTYSEAIALQLLISKTSMGELISKGISTKQTGALGCALKTIQYAILDHENQEDV